MRFEFKLSFEDSLKSLPHKEKAEIREIAILAIDILSRDRFLHQGIGLKRLKGDY